MRHVLIWSPVFLCLAMSCSTVPEVLRVPGNYPGTYWEVVYFEGPVEVEGEVRRAPGETSHLVAQAEILGLRRRGWGTLLPWAWFGNSASYQYSVSWRFEDGSGAHALHFRQPVSGVFTDAQLTHDGLIASTGEEGDHALCDASQAEQARQYLTSAQRLLKYATRSAASSGFAVASNPPGMSE